MPFDYFYGREDAEQYLFYRIPKALITGEQFRDISCESKLLYGLMLDRLSLSMKNGWFDDLNRAYIVYTVEDIMSDLQCGNQKAGKLLQELEQKAGLIKRKRQGLGKPSLIYVLKFSTGYPQKSSESHFKKCEKGKNAKKFRHNTEYGSARWGTHKDIEPFEDPVFQNNVILTKTEWLMMSNRPKNPGNARNKNVLIVGGSGSGKTRFWLKPNLLQMHSSYVVTDPKGSVLVECGNALLHGAPKLDEKGNPLKDKNGKVIREPYVIKVFNTINFKKSMKYNPFAYIHSEKDILKLVTALIANTKGEGKAGDEFWTKAETLLYTALIGYIHYEAPEEEQNFATLLEMLNSMDVREDDEDYQNPVDILFEKLKEKNPNHFAVRQYVKFKMAAGKTLKSILVSCGARLAPFDIQEVRDITMYDELELDTLGDRKTALFLIMSDTDATFNFLIAMIYTQMFNLLCEKADDVYGGRLPVHVRCLIDEAANIGQIPNLEKLVATIRSREISACLVLQAQSQLKAIYKDNADTIIGNMDSRIFLGGTEPTTLKELNQALGKETIDTYNTGESRGREESHSLNYQKLGHDLLSVDELAVLDGSKCILQLRGVRPFLSEKYDLTKHPNYCLTADYDKKNTFDIEKYLNRKMKLKPEDEYVVVNADVKAI